MQRYSVKIVWNKKKEYMQMHVSIYSHMCTYTHSKDSAGTHRSLDVADGVGRVGNGGSRNQVGRRDTFAPFVYPYVLLEFFSLCHVQMLP